MGAYTIGEVARRSGFTTSALRYYEGIGLVAPSERTDGGYRLYDDRALDRLAFVSRAKHLGCSLEEITDLLAIWDGERCGPVQRRFSELVASKIAGAHRQIAELQALTAHLEEAAGLLAGPALDEPCGPGCACLGNRPGGAVPIACTIADGEVDDRVALLHRLRAEARHVERTAQGLRLDFAPGPAVEAEVRRFARDEQRCCAFWRFDVHAEGDELSLRWDGPPEVAELLDRLAGWFRGDEPLPDIRGLL